MASFGQASFAFLFSQLVLFGELLQPIKLTGHQQFPHARSNSPLSLSNLLGTFYHPILPYLKLGNLR